MRREWLHAAAWNRQAPLLEYCRACAAQATPEHWDALELLAVLGAPEDAELLLQLSYEKALGLRRFELLASFGYPVVAERLLEAMTSAVAREAAGAAAAFEHVTGIEVVASASVCANGARSDDSADPCNGDDDAVEANDDAKSDSQVSAQALDIELAYRRWASMRGQLDPGVRLVRGTPVVGVGCDERHVSLRERFEMTLRDSYFGLRETRPQEIERLHREGVQAPG